jgi:hypothetical protein
MAPALAPEQQQQRDRYSGIADRSIGSVGMHEIVRLVSRSTPEVQELRCFREEI